MKLLLSDFSFCEKNRGNNGFGIVTRTLASIFPAKSHSIMNLVMSLRKFFALQSLITGLSPALIPKKTSGSSSFIQQQHYKEDRTISWNVTSPQSLRELAKKSVWRQRGSQKYTKSWGHWTSLSIESIRFHLSQCLPYPVDRHGFEELWFQLGVAADTGERPSFSDAGSRSGYALDFFCRARLLADLLMDVDNPTLPPHWNESIREQRLFHGIHKERTVCNLTSLGGGPGFDYVAAAMVAMHNVATREDGGDNGAIAEVFATILDFEESWQDLVESMDLATKAALQQPGISCHWGGKCDITKPLSHPDNASCLKSISITNLWSCQYCIAENAKLLKETKYVFFRDLFEAVPEGTMFLFTETTPRLWPDFLDFVLSGVTFLELSFPYKRGFHLAIVKRRNASPLRPVDLNLAESFRRMAQEHDLKLAEGWKRQTAKIRGSKVDIIHR